MSRNALALGAAIFVCLGQAWSSANAQFVLGPDFDPDEPIERISVRIDVGNEGEDLQEPVAMDLGLGFPFWLHPVGRGVPERTPFGVIPQQTTAGTSVAAGSGATFTFCLTGEPGQDVLQATPQLLAGVRVSDIGRIGFASRGASGWSLGGYEIQINGRVFASNDGVNLRASDVQESARAELADVRSAVAPLEAERDDLAALSEAELATEEDAARLAEVEAELMPFRARRQLLEAQIAGPYPWFEEPDFCPPWREGSAIASARVTLVTYDHPGADTQNHVYFQTGGHKYLLNSDAEPLSGVFGSQSFELDLLAGPLTAADVRGFAVGMLAHDQPYGDAPDRWHPERILVELDGRIVYDSDGSSVDHDSLQAIRLIPPAHVNEAGDLVANVPTALQTFLWEAGAGLGLDLAGGGAIALPDEQDPLFPGPEPGLVDVGLGMGFFDPALGLFAGECGWPFAGGFCPDGWNPGWDHGWGPPPPWLGFLFDELLPDAHPFPDGGDPPPAGGSFQIDDVRITSGWRLGDTFTVEWAVSGDESEIAGFHVSLVPVLPDEAMPFGLALSTEPAAVGSRQINVELPPVMVADAFHYLAPVVVADPVDPAETPHERIGPAVAVFPTGTSLLGQPRPVNVFSCIHPPILMPMIGLVTPGGEPFGTDRAVWTAGQVESHNAILFDTPTPASNVGVRPEPGDVITVTFARQALTGRHRVVAYVGFLNGAEAANEVAVRMTCWLEPDGGAMAPLEIGSVSPPPLVNPALGPVEPMQRLEMVVDDAGVPWADDSHLTIAFTFHGGAVDPTHPPALFGVRMIPEP